MFHYAGNVMSPYSEVHEEQKGTRVRCSLMTLKCSVFLHLGKKFLKRETDNLREKPERSNTNSPIWWESTTVSSYKSNGNRE
jgi:hypothetical protein